MILKIRRLRDNRDLPLPVYQTSGSAGMDLCADVTETIVMPSLSRRLVPTGIAIELPPGFEAQIRPRSGLAIKHGISLVNTPGTIDADYRGEISVILINLGEADFTIRRGERIAQMIISPVVQAEIVEVAVLGETGRGAGGFGSTGT